LRIEQDSAVWSVAFSPDGSLLATGSWGGTARLIRTADGGEVARVEHGDPAFILTSPDSSVLAKAKVAFSPDGSLLATTSVNGTGRLIRTADGSAALRIEHGAGVGSVAFSPEGSLLATGSDDGTARLIRTVDGREAARVEHGDAVLSLASGRFPASLPPRASPSARTAACSPLGAGMAPRG
jgi:WD40 repeat protein